MWDKIIFGVGAIGVGILISLAAYWAAKQWKSRYREELRSWLHNHPNKKFKKVGLILVLAVDTVISTGERITVDIVGTSDNGNETRITSKTLTVKEAEGMGLIKDNTVSRKEADLYNEAEILALMSGNH